VWQKSHQVLPIINTSGILTIMVISGIFRLLKETVAAASTLFQACFEAILQDNPPALRPLNMNCGPKFSPELFRIE
jgi:hypothetical protein